MAYTPTQSEQVRTLAPRLVMNSFGLPEGIYRPDLLPAPPSIVDSPLDDADSSGGSTIEPENFKQSLVPHRGTALSPQEQYERELKSAYVPLNYTEGYPTLHGMPFWSQLSFEPPEAYLCFMAYLEQGRMGARQLFVILDDPRVRELPFTPSMDELEEYFHLYYWQHRTKAHDLFFAAHRRKERERRAIETEDYHYLQAARLMGICEAYLDEKGEELVETMTPKAFIDFLKTAVQIQRTSVGLSANGDRQNNDTPAGASFEMVLRTIAQQSNLQNTDENVPEEAKNAVKHDKIQKILANPELLTFAQELIIKTGSQGSN